MNTKRITRIAMFTAAALILNLVESALPPVFSFAPGAKMGLGNLVTLVAFVILGYCDAYIILALRCLLGSIFGGNMSMLIYSVPAGFISLTAEVLLFKFAIRIFSITGISFLGAVIHNAVQVGVASIIVGVNLAAMLPMMLIASVIAGLTVGIAAFFIIKYLPQKFYISERI